MNGMQQLILAAGASAFGSTVSSYAFGDKETRNKIHMAAPVIFVLLLAGAKAYEHYNV